MNRFSGLVIAQLTSGSTLWMKDKAGFYQHVVFPYNAGKPTLCGFKYELRANPERLHFKDLIASGYSGRLGWDNPYNNCIAFMYSSWQNIAPEDLRESLARFLKVYLGQVYFESEIWLALSLELAPDVNALIYLHKETFNRGVPVHMYVNERAQEPIRLVATCHETIVGQQMWLERYGTSDTSFDFGKELPQVTTEVADKFAGLLYWLVKK